MYYISKEGSAFSFVENVTRIIYSVDIHNANNDIHTVDIYVKDENSIKITDDALGIKIETFDNKLDADSFIEWIMSCFHFKLMPATYTAFKKRVPKKKK